MLLSNMKSVAKPTPINPLKPSRKKDILRLARQLGKRDRLDTKKYHLTRMKLTYTQYLSTPHWHKFRTGYISSLPTQACKKHRICHKCEVTNCNNCGVIVHHRSYDNLGYEKISDVALVCETCHDSIHNKVRKLRRSSKKSAVRKKESCLPQTEYSNDLIPRFGFKFEYFKPWGGRFTRRFWAEEDLLKAR
jgi:hypothetical protein